MLERMGSLAISRSRIIFSKGMHEQNKVFELNVFISHHCRNDFKFKHLQGSVVNLSNSSLQLSSNYIATFSCLPSIIQVIKRSCNRTSHNISVLSSRTDTAAWRLPARDVCLLRLGHFEWLLEYVDFIRQSPSASFRRPGHNLQDLMRYVSRNAAASFSHHERTSYLLSPFSRS